MFSFNLDKCIVNIVKLHTAHLFSNYFNLESQTSQLSKQPVTRSFKASHLLHSCL